MSRSPRQTTCRPRDSDKIQAIPCGTQVGRPDAHANRLGVDEHRHGSLRHDVFTATTPRPLIKGELAGVGENRHVYGA